MVECSSCGEQFGSLSEFDEHLFESSCLPVDENGVVRHAVAVEKQPKARRKTEAEKPKSESAPAKRVTEARGGKEAEVSKAPESEKRG